MALPIVTTFRAGTDLEPLSDLLLQYVAAVGRFTGLGSIRVKRFW